MMREKKVHEILMFILQKKKKFPGLTNLDVPKIGIQLSKWTKYPLALILYHIQTQTNTHAIFIPSLFKPANLKNPHLRNEMNWSYITELQAHFTFFFL